MRTIFVLLITIFIFSLSLYAQKKICISGMVTDENEKPLAYVNIYFLNSADGTMSDEKGEFFFYTNLTGGQTLVASMIGYKKNELKLILDKNISGISLQLHNEAVQLNETIITASSYGSEKEKGLVVSQRDVYLTPGGAADLFQSLKTLPGLTQVSESAELYVRGGDPTETITMINQATIYHPSTFESAYGGLFSNLNTSTIKGMFFSSGGFSAKYGNALSGVLDVETKNEPSLKRINLGLSMANVSADIDIPIIEEKLGIGFNARQTFTKPIFWLNGTSDRITVMPASSDINFAVSYRYSSTGRLKLFTLFAKDNQGVEVERAEYDGTFSGSSNNYLINLQHSDILLGDLLIKTGISLNEYENKWVFGILDLNKKDYAYKLRSDLEKTFGKKIKFNFGGEVERRESKFIGIIPAEDYDIRPEGAGEVINASLFTTRYGGYGELELSEPLMLNNFFVSTGMRADYFPDFNVTWVDPRFNFGYKFTEDFNVKFATGLFHQLPDPRLYSKSDGNPNLKPMKAIHYIFSGDWSPNSITDLRVEAYYKKYSNLPMENDLLNYDNSGYGEAKGVDVIIKGVAPFGITGWVSYGFINTKREWMDYDTYTRSDFDITHNFALVLNYFITDSWLLGLNYKYATGRPYNPVTGSIYNDDYKIYIPVYGETNSACYPNYQRLDMRITFLTQLFGKYFSVCYLEALNILNIKNLFGYSYSPDYSEKKEISSYFGRRILVIGATINL